jgi:hypothetical protein
VVLNHKWRWKQMANEKDTNLEEEEPQADAENPQKLCLEVRSSCSTWMAGVGGACHDHRQGRTRSGSKATGVRWCWRRSGQEWVVQHFQNFPLGPCPPFLALVHQILASCRSYRVDVNKEEEEKHLEKLQCMEIDCYMTAGECSWKSLANS